MQGPDAGIQPSTMKDIYPQRGPQLQLGWLSPKTVEITALLREAVGGECSELCVWAEGQGSRCGHRKFLTPTSRQALDTLLSLCTLCVLTRTTTSPHPCGAHGHQPKMPSPQLHTGHDLLPKRPALRGPHTADVPPLGCVQTRSTTRQWGRNHPVLSSPRP